MLLRFLGVAALVAGSVSTPARACSRIVPRLFDGVFFFEGQEIPRNAELRSASFVSDRIPVPLTKPDGTVVELEVGVDDFGQFIIVDGLLDPGPHALSIGAPGGNEPDRIVTFIVSDEVDDEAPDAPLASASRGTVGVPFGFGSTCDSEWPTDVVTVTVTTREPIAFVDFGALEDRSQRVGVRTNDDTIEIVLGEDRGGDVDYEVVARDFAGNESAPTTVTVWGGCDGGCASSSSLPMAAVLLALARRRARSARPE